MGTQIKQKKHTINNFILLYGLMYGFYSQDEQFELFFIHNKRDKMKKNEKRMRKEISTRMHQSHNKSII